MTKNNTNFTKEKLITYSDFVDDVFGGFKNDKERIKYMKNSAYAKMNLAKSFGIFYGSEVSSGFWSYGNILGAVYNGSTIIIR